MNINNWMFLYCFMAKVLVTGFEPFSSHLNNISGDVLAILDKQKMVCDPWKEFRNYQLDDIEVYFDTLLLSVDEIGSKTVAKKLSQGEEWDLIIHLGLCNNCEVPRIELLAQNILDMGIKDNSGRQLRGRKIGDLIYKSTINPDLILTNKGNVNAEISFDAGQFVCNETYYNTLSAISQNNLECENTQCLFLHLPNYDKYSLDSARYLLMEMIGRILFKPVISVAAGVIIGDGKMLVARRNDNNYRGLWEFPGGKFEWGETPSQAIERELKEEFSWNVQRIKSFGKWFHQTADFDIELNVEICRFIGSSPDLEMRKSWTSHDEVKWIVKDDEVAQYVGLDRLVAKELSKELSNPSSGIS